MPCGLLYSALMVAALTGNALEGALTMACFALGSGLSLGLAPWLLLMLKSLGDGAWGIRLAGLALAITSGWALWRGLAHNQAPWCVAYSARFKARYLGRKTFVKHVSRQ